MLDATTQKRILNIIPFLNERSKRAYLGAEALSIGRGGIKAISEFTGVDPKTIASGIQDIDDDRKNNVNHERYKKRIRSEGGGRILIEEKNSEILKVLNDLVADYSFGNPENPLRWTTKSTRNLSDALKKIGFNVSHTTVSRLLKELGYSLHVNQKNKQVGKESPYRDDQFKYINENTKKCIEDKNPVCSIDCKKKENIGNFKNNGSEYCQKYESRKVMDHDFPLPDMGKAVPYGIYDIDKNIGYVSVGISSDTAEFAVNSIRMWWKHMGQVIYPSAKKLYLVADGGGSNSSRSRLWKLEIQKFSNEINLPIQISHYPPGTSKWNKIEHRMFCEISKNWRGRPLETLDVIVNCISSTTTKTGLYIQCGIDMSTYEVGIKVSNENFKNISIVYHDFCGNWNYTIFPYKYILKYF